MDRNWLNERLLTEAEKRNNVAILFEHKLLRCDIIRGAMTFLVEGEEKIINADVIIGADGVYSQVRTGLMRTVKSDSSWPEVNNRMDFSQKYIDCTWCELEIPASDILTEWGEFAIIPERLHIWPRGNFMLIALPNNVREEVDKTDVRINHLLVLSSCRSR
jgi:kynurenine 3-monooxygenase